MIKKLLKNKTYSNEEFLKELLNPTFERKKIDEIYKNNNIDINWQNNKKESFLHLCAKVSYLESSEWLLKKNINLEAQTDDGSTAIFYAIQSNSLEILSLLVNYGANINHINIYKRTLLQEATISCNSKILNYLIKNSSNISNVDIHGNNLIFDAVSSGSGEIIKLIASLEEVDVNHINNNGNIVLQQEVILKNNLLATSLMELGANPTIQDKNGKNFLFYSIAKGIKNIAVLEKAIELGCDINSRSSTNSTILSESLNHFLQTPKSENEQKESHLEMAKALIQKGVDINALDDKGETAFFIATRSEDTDLIELFLNNKEININHKNNKGETALYLLVLGGIRNKDLIIKYINHSADPNIRNSENKNIIETLIDIVLFYQNNIELPPRIEGKLDVNGEYLSILKLIITKSEINLNQLNGKGEPLFFTTILNFNLNLFNIFRDNNINLNLKDNEGNNIIFALMNYNNSHTIKDKKAYLDMLQNLINIGVDVDAKNNEKQTPLHKAVVEKCEYTVRTLLESKADSLAVDEKGRSIIHNCIWKDTARYFKLIHSYNKDIINIVDGFGMKPINYAAFMGKTDLVIEMLHAGALVNNPEEKDPKILEFFKKFHKNILALDKNSDNEIDKRALRLLATTMIEEFDIKEE